MTNNEGPHWARTCSQCVLLVRERHKWPFRRFESPFGNCYGAEPLGQWPVRIDLREPTPESCPVLTKIRNEVRNEMYKALMCDAPPSDNVV